MVKFATFGGQAKASGTLLPLSPFRFSCKVSAIIHNFSTEGADKAVRTETKTQSISLHGGTLCNQN